VPGAPRPSDAAGDPWNDVDPSAALTRLGPLAVEVRGRAVVDLLAPAYDALVEGG
jgi:hypothetical protein